MNAIEVRDLTVRMGGTVILDRLSFTIPEGEIVSLIGPNGAGKSTLLKALLGLLPFQSGEVVAWGKPVRSGEVLPGAGYVPQRFAVDRTFPVTVEELLLLGYSKGWLLPWRKAGLGKEALETVGLAGAAKLLHKPVGSLSGGEMQRVLIARALLRKPKILFLDEALAGVDVAGEQLLSDLITSLNQQEGLTLVMVSHDIQMVFTHAHRVLCLHGSLLCQGTPEEVAANGALPELFGGHKSFYGHHHHEDRE